MRRGARHDVPADVGTAREEDFVDLRAVHERPAGVRHGEQITLDWNADPPPPRDDDYDEDDDSTMMMMMMIVESKFY